METLPRTVEPDACLVALLCRLLQPLRRRMRSEQLHQLPVPVPPLLLLVVMDGVAAHLEEPPAMLTELTVDVAAHTGRMAHFLFQT